MKAAIQILIANTNVATRSNSDPSVKAAFQECKERGIPLVLCTSGTFEETEEVRHTLGITDPFIVENGGAIYFRKGYFSATDVPCESKGDFQKVSLGLPYAQTVLFLSLIKKLVPSEIVGFSDLATSALADESGLSKEQARKAQLREYDEPFRIAGNARSALERIERTVKGSGFKLIHGERYHHLLGGSDQARAIAVLRRLYQDCYGTPMLAALGNSISDGPVLANVDRPMVLATPDGRHYPRFVQQLPEPSRTSIHKAKNLDHALSDMVRDWEQCHAQ